MEQHFFRINVVPYWEWNSERLSKDSDCRDTTANAPAVGDITDADCIVAPQFGNTAELRFFNVINEHFNVYVEVNGTNVISEPSTSDLGSSFTVNLDAGDNLIRIRLAAKGGQPTAEVYDSDSFYYKVTATESTDATLSGLALTDPDNNAITLDPTFASNVESYTATVANAVSQIKVEPTKSDDNATIEYLDSADMALTDADTNTTVFDVDLDEGANVIKVKVTAEDTTTTKTYTLTITRVDFLVSNLGQPESDNKVIGLDIGGGTRAANASQFTTGNNATGYQITAVRLEIGIIGDAVPRVSIYSDSANSPGSSLKVLTNPSNLPSVTRIEYDDGYINIAQRDFTTSDLKLEASKKYWVVIERASGNDGILFNDVGTTATDPGTAPGWEINGNKFQSDGDSWADTNFTDFPAQFAVKGALSTVSDDATLSALALRDPSNNVVALNPTFASGVEEYTATVANAVSQIKVEPTKSDDNATIEYLDSADMALTDADTNTTVFDVDLDEGANVIKVKVTAEDTTTTKTYTLTITRVDFLVSNLGQPESDNKVIGLDIGGGTRAANASQFTTGNNATGYQITAVRLEIGIIGDAVPRVSIYSDSANSPGSSLKVLTNPSNLPSVTRIEYDDGYINIAQRDFTTSDLKLEASKKYWVVIERASGNDGILFNDVGTTATDPGTAPGWEINGNKFQSDGDSWADTNFTDFPAQFAVKGALSTVSDDATLSALALRDPSNNVVALNPTFASGVEEYTATVANAVSQIKVEPTKNDDNASIQYGDSNDMALIDADTNTGVFDFDLAEGENVIKVEVTAEDGTTIKTYQVTVTRVDFLVSNLGQTDFGNFGVNSSRPALGVKFTTGSSAGGYKIDSVPLVVSAPSGTIPEVSIYSDNSGEPGSSIKVLKNPSNIPTSLGPKRNFDAADYQLDPSTSYWIVIERRSGTDQISVRITGDTEEDPGSAPGWNIGDRAAAFDSASWTSSTTSTLKLAVKGEPITPVITLAADFTSIIRELHELTFTLNANRLNRAGRRRDPGGRERRRQLCRCFRPTPPDPHL